MAADQAKSPKSNSDRVAVLIPAWARPQWQAICSVLAQMQPPLTLDLKAVAPDKIVGELMKRAGGARRARHRHGPGRGDRPAGSPQRQSEPDRRRSGRRRSVAGRSRRRCLDRRDPPVVGERRPRRHEHRSEHHHGAQGGPRSTRSRARRSRKFPGSGSYFTSTRSSCRGSWAGSSSRSTSRARSGWRSSGSTRIRTMASFASPTSTARSLSVSSVSA